MKILVLNGPNLNMLGQRDPAHYGTLTLTELEKELASYGMEAYEDLELVFYQTNHEGQLIDLIQRASLQYGGVIFNPGAYSHYSYALRDAVEAAGLPVVEVHLSDISLREEFRRHSVIVEVCAAQFKGKKLDSYKEALDFLITVLAVSG